MGFWFGLAPQAVAQGTEENTEYDPTKNTSSADDDRYSDVEVIRVKGRGIQAIQTDVPDSVTQFDAAEIEALGAQNIADLAAVTPNVEIRTAGATSPTFFIRGVGLSDFSASAVGSVAIYQDTVPVNAPGMQLSLIYDLENVDVKRGPQGWGSNRNASGGTIRLLSRKPTGELSAGLKSEYGKFNMQDYEGHIEVPIVEEILSARLAFRLIRRDGYLENGCAGAPAFEDRFGVSDPGDLPNDGTTVLPGFLNPAFNNVRFCAPATTTSASVSAAVQGESPLGRVKANTPPPTQINLGGGTTRYSIVPGGLKRFLNNQDEWSARGIFRITPPELEMDWLIKVHGSRLKQDSDVGQSIGTNGPAGGLLGCRTSAGYIERDVVALAGDDTPCNPSLGIDERLARELDANPWRGDFNRQGQTMRDIFGMSITGTWDVGPVTLHSVSAYDQYSRFQERDQDFSPDIIFENILQDRAHQWFQEVKISGEFEETPFRWNVGGYYLREQLTTNLQSLTASLNTDSIRDYTQDLWSWATYADFAWDFLDDFTVEGGVRWNVQESDLFFTIGFANSGANVGQPRFNGREVLMAPTGGIALTYRFREGVSAFWKYTRGWKPGTWNTSAQRGRFVSFAEPEEIDSFEWGLNGNWFEGNLTFRGSFFFYNYRNYQVFTVDDEPGAPPTLRVINAEGAENFGVEVDIRAQPLVGLVPSAWDGLVLTTRAGWIEAKFLEFSTDIIRNVGIIGALPIIQDFTGNSLPNAPRFTVSGAAEWTFDLGRWGTIIPRYDFSWRDDTYFDNNLGRGSRNINNEEFLPELTIGQVAYVIHNARLLYRTPEGNVEVAGWVRNIGNQAAKQTAFDASAFSNLTVNFVNLPRTWGVSIKLSW